MGSGEGSSHHFPAQKSEHKGTHREMCKFNEKSHTINISMNSHRQHYVNLKVTQSCPTLCDPMDCSSPGSSVHGILQAGTLEWVVISSSRKIGKDNS